MNYFSTGRCFPQTESYNHLFLKLFPVLWNNASFYFFYFYFFFFLQELIENIKDKWCGLLFKSYLSQSLRDVTEVVRKFLFTEIIMWAQYSMRSCPFSRNKSLEVDINSTASRRKKSVFELSLNRVLGIYFGSVKLSWENVCRTELREQCWKDSG